MARLTTIFLTLLMLIATALQAGEINSHYTVQQPTVALRADGFHHLLSPPGPVWGPAGSPELPHLSHQFSLPPGEEIQSVRLENAVWTPLSEKVRLYPRKPSGSIKPERTAAFHGSGSIRLWFKSDLSRRSNRRTRTDFLCGHSIGSISITAARWQPLSGRLEALTAYDLVITTHPTPRAGEAFSTRLKRNSTVQARLSRQVDNIEASNAYGTLDETDDFGCHYLIITSTALQSAFQEQVWYRTGMGLQAEIKLVEDIATQYQGADLPAKIRNCILDYYMNNWLQYVLLGGDTELVPKKRFWAQMNGGAPNDPDPDIASDLYYSNLDGNWNADGDNFYGEPGDIPDLYSEVAIGRMSASTFAQAQYLIAKTRLYETQPVASEITRGLMVGEDLGWQVWGSQIKNEIRFGSNSAGYTTVGFPATFQVDTLYETPGYHFNAMTELLPMLNGGQHLINHMGHGDVGWVMKFSSGQVTNNNFTNNGLDHNFYIAYSQACYAGSFDNRTGSFTYTFDCICENFTNISTGAVGFVANSRFGWGAGSNTNGPSQFYDREFFDALFGENEYKLGWINADSKEDNVPRISWASLRCFYETNLLGDPALELWTAAPTAFSPTYPAMIMLPCSQFDVNVGTAGALVVVSGSNEVKGEGMSNAEGIATVYISDPITTPGIYLLSIRKHNYLPFQGSINFSNAASALNLTLTPSNPPILIPASGGSFNYTIAVANTDSVAASFQGWIMQYTPGGLWQGPMLGPVGGSVPAGVSITRLRTQTVPGSAAPGTYIYRGYLGQYSSVKWDSSSFTYVKSSTGKGPWVPDWDNSGESFAPYLQEINPISQSVVPARFGLDQNRPNPFNPATIIRYQIPSAQTVSLQAFNAIGQLMATLAEGWQQAGTYEVVFDGSGLPSGLYFLRLQAGTFTETKKMMLVK